MARRDESDELLIFIYDSKNYEVLLKQKLCDCHRDCQAVTVTVTVTVTVPVTVTVTVTVPVTVTVTVRRSQCLPQLAPFPLPSRPADCHSVFIYFRADLRHLLKFWPITTWASCSLVPGLALALSQAAEACGPGRRSTRVILGHACETLAVMHLQRGPPSDCGKIGKINPPRIERILSENAWNPGASVGSTRFPGPESKSNFS